MVTLAFVCDRGEAADSRLRKRRQVRGSPLRDLLRGKNTPDERDILTRTYNTRGS